MRKGVIVIILFVISILLLKVYADMWITVIHEVQAAPDSLEKIELHWAPAGIGVYPETLNLGGTQIRTRAGTAFINSGIILTDSGYVVIDSTNTTGVFSLNAVTDTVKISIPGWWEDYVVIRNLPPYKSFATFNIVNRWGKQSLNRYIDDTPTFGYENNDWSSISGCVRDTSNQPISLAEVWATSPIGESWDWTDSLGQYFLLGLGAGKYQVSVQSNVGNAIYPESVYVPFSTHITNINFILPQVGITEHNKYVRMPINFYLFPNPSSTPKIYLQLSELSWVEIKIYDSKGSLVKSIAQANLLPGEYTFSWNGHNEQNDKTVAGVYFVNLKAGSINKTAKLILDK